MAVIEHCPTCGAPVRVVSDYEGTSHYEPIDSDRSSRLAIRTGAPGGSASADPQLAGAVDLLREIREAQQGEKWPHGRVLRWMSDVDALLRDHPAGGR